VSEAFRDLYAALFECVTFTSDPPGASSG
jgi:hypothetical protein